MDYRNTTKKATSYELIALPTNKEPNFLEKWYANIISKFLLVFNVIFRMACCIDLVRQQQAFNFTEEITISSVFSFSKILDL